MKKPFENRFQNLLPFLLDFLHFWGHCWSNLGWFLAYFGLWEGSGTGLGKLWGMTSQKKWIWGRTLVVWGVIWVAQKGILDHIAGFGMDLGRILDDISRVFLEPMVIRTFSSLIDCPFRFLTFSPAAAPLDSTLSVSKIKFLD